MRDDPIELLTNSQMAMADRLTIEAGTPGTVLMERAGAAVADAARQMLARSDGGRVAILCGPGNNGGDGFVAARYLRTMGFSVQAGLLGSVVSLKGDAADAARAWTGRIASAALVELEEADLVIDALFGAGLTRDIDGRARSIVERVNQWRGASGKPVLAVDVPSGIDGDTGTVRGASIEADETVTFFRLKPGHILLPGRELCGRVRLEQIGIEGKVLAEIAPVYHVNAPGLWRGVLPAPSVTGHKYSRGHALVVSGPAHQTGAARLAGAGALRAGAGLVTLAAQADAVAANAAHLTAIMIAPFDGPEGLRATLDDARKNVLAIGPGAGAGEQTRTLVELAMGHRCAPAMVIDADAITSFENDAAGLRELAALAERPVIITPHEGEFSRLFAGLKDVPAASSTDPRASRLRRALAAADYLQVIVCLKGPDTIVAAPDGRCSIMREAPPWLATAGSGDVLTGMITGLLAQGMPGFEAACAGVWVHARAAQILGPGLIAEDIPICLAHVWRELQ